MIKHALQLNHLNNQNPWSENTSSFLKKIVKKKRLQKYHMENAYPWSKVYEIKCVLI